MQFNLGDKVRDTLTGIEGIITYKVQYLTGCDQYGVHRGLNKDGEPQKEIQIDENRLELIETKSYKLPVQKTEKKPELKPGGPQTIINQKG